mgnify:FL=1
MKTSIGLKVVEIIYFATPVRSISVTVLAKDVPFNIKIISFPYAGNDCLIAIGIWILKKIIFDWIPKLLPASIKPGLIVSNADRKISDVYAPVFKEKAIIAHQ